MTPPHQQFFRSVLVNPHLPPSSPAHYPNSLCPILYQLTSLETPAQSKQPAFAMSALMNSLRPSLRTAAGGYGRLFSTSTPRAASKMILTGRLGAEPEMQATASGQEVVRYSVGCSYGRSTERRTSWFRVAAFQNEGTQRDFLLNLPKG